MTVKVLFSCLPPRTLLMVVLCLCIRYGRSQGILTEPVSGTFNDITIVEFLEILENRHGAKFIYQPTKIPYYQQSFTFDQEPLYRALARFLEGSKLDVIKYQDVIVLADKNVITRDQIERLLDKWESGEYQKPISEDPEVLELTFGDSIARQTGHVRLTGRVVDKYSQSPIIGAIIQNLQSGQGTTTDEDGRYELEAASGVARYLVSYLGYQPIDLTLGWYADGEYDFKMSVRALNLSEVVVEASALQNKVEEAQIGVEALNVKDIRELPSFLGEADVMKSIENLPGVSAVGEASSGFNVRGGNIDQNLVMLDDAMLFNASHALGFFSIFNAGAVRNVSLYKGNIPAQYGGRLSSVLQVELKDGNDKKWQGQGGVGVASARLVMDGPLSEKTGAVIGLRSSYANWLLRRVKKSNVQNSRVYFGDALIKLTQRLSDEHTLTASGYLSYDYFRFAREFGYHWSTSLANLRWRYLISNQMSLSASLVAGYYDSNQFVPEGDGAFDLFNGISYLKGKSNLSYQNDRHFFNVGIEAIRLKMDPERIEPFNQSSSVRPDEVAKDQGIEWGLYANDEFRISPHLLASVGLRLSNYISQGPGEIRTYDPDLPLGPASILRTERVGNREKIVSYQGLEPRLSFNWLWDSQQSFKFSYNHLYQYIHLISNTASPTPVDIWQLANVYLEPQKSHNYSAGYFRDAGNEWAWSLEGFYKSINGMPQFRDLARLLVNAQLETEVLGGKGRAYGFELAVEKKSGNWRGTVAYTYSRSEAKTTGTFAEDIINGNNWYPSHFDQPHQFSLALKHWMDPIQQVIFAFTFRSGRPITVPVANYEVQDILVTHYSERNQFRVPAYHRLDFGYSIDRRQAKMRGFRSRLTLSVYNLYGRRNIYSIYFRNDSRGIQRAYKLAILGSVFPSLTWNFTF